MSGRDAWMEPRFDRGPDLDLRLSDEDRPGMPLPERPRAPRRKPKKPRRAVRSRRSLLGRVVRGLFVLGFLAFTAVAGVVIWYGSQLPATRDLAIPNRPPNVAMVATSGAVFANRGAGGEALRLDELPRHLPQAVLAIEDRRFYSHFGLDPIGLIRAATRNAAAGDVVEGGSTITQQLAKNLFLTPERTIERKIQEVILSVWLETEYSKDRILETYLNRVYFGAGAFGVEAAAQRYFGKSARQVTLLEAAVLAGLLKAPSKFSPTRNAEAARGRAEIVLGRMVEAGFLKEKDAKAALAQPLKTAGGSNSSSVNYVADWLMDQVEGFIGEIDRDVVVDTTIDLRLQEAAERALVEGLEGEGRKLNASQGALTAIDATGAVRVLVGGRSYAESQFNRAVTAKRQPGSAFKPFVYLAALEGGMTTDTILVDQPVTIGEWSPENFDHKYRGPVSLREALALSLNTVAAQLAAEVGPPRVISTAYRLGISSKLRPEPSIALGTSEVTPLELAAAFVPFANGGYGVIPYAITRIRTKDGKTLYERKAAAPSTVIAPYHVAAMNAMLADTITMGTGRRAELPGWQAAGKTGTSQEFRDAWFIGYTAHLTAGIWLGNDNNAPMKRATGGSLPAAIWARFMAEAHRDVAATPLPGLDTPYIAAADPGFDEELPWRRQELRPPPRRHREDPVSGFFRRLFGG